MKLTTKLYKKLSIRNKLFIYFLILSLVPLISFSSLSIYFIYSQFKESESRYFIDKMYNLNLEVDKILQAMDSLMLKILTNYSITTAITSPHTPPSLSWYEEKSTIENILYSYTSAYPELTISIITPNKNFYSTKNEYYFEELVSPLSKYVVDNHCTYTNPKLIDPYYKDSILLSKPLYSKDNLIGIIYISLNLSKLSTLLEPFNYYGINFWIIDDNKDVIYSNHSAEDFSHTPSNYTSITHRSSYSNWELVSILPNSYVFKESYLLILGSVFLIVLILCLSFILSRLLSTNLTKRILNMADASNDFIRKISNNTFNCIDADELTILEKSNAYMYEKIIELIEQIQLREKEKKETEFKFLQAQINPHMIYNTLNTITHLANLQNVRNISEVSCSFANLLKKHYSSSDEFNSIREECQIIQDYINLKKYNIFNSIIFNYFIDDELKSHPILKLLLQPIIENCIFHGIGEETLILNISLHAYIKDYKVYVTIVDDGIGMSKHTLNILYNDIKKATLASNHIGLRNIKQRLFLYYGTNSGLAISSVPYQETSITLWYPLNTFKEELLHD